MAAPALSYQLGEHGWAGFHLTMGASSTEVGPFGYCTDALGDLVRLALAIATGAVRAEASFDGEPFEWRLIVQRDWASSSGAMVTAQLLTFPDFNSTSSEEAGREVFMESCTADAFASAVLDAASDVWSRFGEAGYNQRWEASWNNGAGFPLRALKALRVALGATEAERPRA